MAERFKFELRALSIPGLADVLKLSDVEDFSTILVGLLPQHLLVEVDALVNAIIDSE